MKAEDAEERKEAEGYKGITDEKRVVQETDE